MLGSHHHLQRESLAARRLEVFSISSLDQDTSVTRQALSAASPHTVCLCGRYHRVPRGGWSASSLRRSRGMTDRTRFGVRDGRIFRPLCSYATEPRISIHLAPVHQSQTSLILLTGREILIPRSAGA